jgi:TP901 family phage tail tape measure protein
MIRETDAGILRLKNQMANISVAPNLSGARDKFVSGQGSMIQLARQQFAEKRRIESFLQSNRRNMANEQGSLARSQIERDILRQSDKQRIVERFSPELKGLGASSRDIGKFADQYQLSRMTKGKAEQDLLNQMVAKYGMATNKNFNPSDYNALRKNTTAEGAGLSWNKQFDQSLNTEKILSLNKEVATSQAKLANFTKIQTQEGQRHKDILTETKKTQDALVNSKKNGVKQAKVEAAEEEKSQKNILKLKMAGMMADKKNKQERLKDIQDAARMEQEALRTQSQLTSDIMSKWGGLVVIMQEIGNHLLHNLELTKQFRQAIILSGVDYSEGAFNQTAFGMDIGQMGSVYKAISRSAFPKDFQGKESMLAYFEDMFGVEAGAVVPMVGGMKSMFGNGVSMDKIMKQMMATSATSSFDFSGWSSIAMQGAVPALADLGVSIEEISALLAGISNMGGGPFAAGFGLSGLSQLAAPSKKQAGVLAQLGITKPSEFIRANGVLGLLKKINEETEKLDAAARDNAIKELFPSMTKGTSLMIMNNLDYFNKKVKEYSNPWNQASSIKKDELLPLNQLKEIGALFRNINAQITELITGSFAVQLVFGTIRQILKGVVDSMIAINKNPILKQVLGLVAAFTSILGVIKLIKLLMVDIGMLAGSFKTFGMLQPSTWMSVGTQEKMSVFLGKASPLLTALGGVAAGIGTIAIGVNAIKALAEARHQKEAIKQADNNKILYDLIDKRHEKGYLTPEEQRAYDRASMPLLGSHWKIAGEGQPEIRFVVEVSGKTDANSNPELGQAIADKLVENTLMKGLLSHSGNG